jgi:hypothetical protein
MALAHVMHRKAQAALGADTARARPTPASARARGAARYL